MRLLLLEDKKNDEKIGLQNNEMKDLKDIIDKKQGEVNSKLKKVEEDRKVSNFEEEKNRKYSKANAALVYVHYICCALYIFCAHIFV